MQPLKNHACEEAAIFKRFVEVQATQPPSSVELKLQEDTLFTVK